MESIFWRSMKCDQSQSIFQITAAEGSQQCICDLFCIPGDLRKKIQIVRRSDGETYDDEGFPVESETIVRTCWARVSGTSGTELIKAGQELADAKKRFLVRWTDTEINESMYVLYNGEYYNIVLVNTYADDGRYTEIWTQKNKAVV